MPNDTAAGNPGGETPHADSKDRADLIEQTSGQQRAADAEKAAHRRAEDAERGSEMRPKV